ncbi:hypothetical protein VSH64_05805 [Amycolatopsis rhabdoformis]|uniref:Aldolase n=1 Tax=Amycolatopsis rhabdoformis TaxID=1448059 RepID=A0ABZ1ICI0_9PSEU|nr:hypothetical protein [Amycolatopsis rhabdoformis]WSE31622.1 hypothetical protein VSH64_05805 [Amycolatopsis rhabdoformis]
MTPPHAGAARLANPGGSFTMVSVDHRESLRTLMAAGAPVGTVSDERLCRFKAAAVAALAPHASAVLVDSRYGLVNGPRAGIPAGTRFVLAVDRLVQEPGGPVLRGELAGEATADFLGRATPDAIKLLVLFRPGHPDPRRDDTVARFLDLGRRCGVPTLLEGMVRCAPEARDEAIHEAAVTLCAAGPDLYKAEIPGYRDGDVSAVARQSARLTAELGVPWAVLSSGITPADYPAAVLEACRGGASGFLAGRAIWHDVVAEDPPGPGLRATAAPRLAALSAAVREAVGAR